MQHANILTSTDAQVGGFFFLTKTPKSYRIKMHLPICIDRITPVNIVINCLMIQSLALAPKTQAT